MSSLELVKRFFVALNAKDEKKVISMISPKAVIHTPLGSFTGREAYWQWMLTHWRAIPDFTHEVRGMALESGATVAFELHAFGKMTGPLALPTGDVQPTGKSLDVSAVNFWQFDDQRVAVYHLYFDRLDFFEQLGLTPVN